ncbi:MAG TPA: MFS transporter [Steroidobacteraceae bacterium]|nr:MFS transporter [Steroidobacteraceae bacterium]
MAEQVAAAVSAPALAPGEAAAQPGDFPGVGRACYALAIFIFSYFLYFSDVQIITLLVGPIKQAYRINDTSFSLLAAGPPVIAILAVGLPMAALVDRWNRRNLLVAAILVWTAMNVLCAFAPSFEVLFALKVGVAIGGVWYYPTVVSLLSDFFAPRHRTTAFTMLQLCGTSGVGLAVLMSGGAIALAHRLSTVVIPLVGPIAWWQWAFILVSAPAPLGAALLLTIREPRRHLSRGADRRDLKLAPYLRRHWQVCAAIALGTAVANGLIYATRSWLPEYFIRVFSEKPAEAAAVSGAILMLGSGLGIGAGGVLAHWLKRRGLESANLVVVIASYTAPLALLLLLPLLGTAGIAAVVLGGAFLLFNMHGGPQIDIIQGVVPNEIRGRFITFVLIVSYGGAFLGPVAVGFLNDHVFGVHAGIRYSMTVTLLLACIAAAFCWSVRARSLAALLRA